MQDELIPLLAGRHGHFQMESGYHSDCWFDLDRLFLQPARLRPFVAELARRLGAYSIDAVCGPMTGGAKLARLIADELHLEYFFAERFEGPNASGLFSVRYEISAPFRVMARGRSFAIVDDGISAGSAVRATFADVLACQARPVVLGALFVFGEATAAFAAQNRLGVEAIARMPFGMWKPEECPLCKAGVPAEKITNRA